MTIAALVQLLIVLLVLGIILWLVFYVLQQFAVPEPVGKLIRIVAVVIVVLIVIVLLMQIAGIGWHGSLLSPP